MSDTKMIVAATNYSSAASYIAVARMKILGDGSLSYDSGWGTQYAGAGYLERYAPFDPCGTVSCEITAGYVFKPVEGIIVLPQDFYIAGNVRVPGGNWDLITAKISSISGDVKAEFNGGWVRTAFDQPASTHDDYAAGLYVYQNDVYLAAQVAQKCKSGIGMTKIDGTTGALNSAFGTGGKMVFGGEGNIVACNLNARQDVPNAISATGGRIGVAGYSRYRDFNSVFRVNPMLAVVDAVNGALLDLNSHRVERADGTRYGDAALYGIYGGPSATSPFTVSGYGRDESAGNTLSYLSGKLVPLPDGIFSNGFEN